MSRYYHVWEGREDLIIRTARVVRNVWLFRAFRQLCFDRDHGCERVSNTTLSRARKRGILPDRELGTRLFDSYNDRRNVGTVCVDITLEIR